MGKIILLIRCIYIGNNGARFQKKVLQLLPIFRVEVYMCGCRDTGVELIRALL